MVEQNEDFTRADLKEAIEDLTGREMGHITLIATTKPDEDGEGISYSTQVLDDDMSAESVVAHAEATFKYAEDLKLDLLALIDKLEDEHALSEVDEQ